MNVKLIVVGGEEAGRDIPISTPTFLIGRGDFCHLRPESNLIGHVHCQISVEHGAVVLEDCGGALGTFVNGEKVLRLRSLKHSDRIKIGTMELEVCLAATDDRGEKKKPIHDKQEAVPHKVAASAVVDNETDISGWLDVGNVGQRKEANGHEYRAGLPPAKTAAIGKVVTRPKTPAKPVAKGLQGSQAQAYEPEIEWNGADLLLLSAIGILVVVLLSYVVPMVWPDWLTWENVHWVWSWTKWYGNNWWNFWWLRWGRRAAFGRVDPAACTSRLAAAGERLSMNRPRRIRFQLDRVEWLLIGVIAVMFFTGMFLLWASPTWWGWYLRVLDVRYWGAWMWIGVIVALVEILLMIRLWPRKKQNGPTTIQRCRQRPHDHPEAPIAVCGLAVVGSNRRSSGGVVLAGN